ncbi:MAG: MBL fold metallo-hydrolase [Candidatus Aenigmatarchaeota archaeon]
MYVHQINGYSNSFIIEFEENVILIDCGFDKKAKNILKKLKEIGKPLKYILITHSHIDHILGLHEIYKNYPYAKIVAHKNSVEYLLGKKFRYPKDFKKYIFKLLTPFLGYKGFKPHIEIDDEGKIENIKIIYTPGHTDDHLCFLIDNSLFIGDLLDNERNKLEFAPKEFNENENLIIKSLNKILDNYNFDKIYFGHGKPIEEDAKSILEEFLKQNK